MDTFVDHRRAAFITLHHQDRSFTSVYNQLII